MGSAERHSPPRCGQVKNIEMNEHQVPSDEDLREVAAKDDSRAAVFRLSACGTSEEIETVARK